MRDGTDWRHLVRLLALLPVSLVSNDIFFTCLELQRMHPLSAARQAVLLSILPACLPALLWGFICYETLEGRYRKLFWFLPVIFSVAHPVYLRVCDPTCHYVEVYFLYPFALSLAVLLGIRLRKAF